MRRAALSARPRCFEAAWHLVFGGAGASQSLPLWWTDSTSIPCIPGTINRGRHSGTKKLVSLGGIIEGKACSGLR